MLRELRAKNRARAKMWQGDGKPADALFAAVELAGEAGELCNLIKKRERLIRGLSGGSVDRQAIADEMADVVICDDLLADRLGIDLHDAVVSKFNRDSEKRGFPQRLGTDRNRDRGGEILFVGREDFRNDRRTMVLTTVDGVEIPFAYEIILEWADRIRSGGADTAGNGEPAEMQEA